MPWLALKPAFKLTLAGLESHIDRNGFKGLVVILISTILFWHIYTPLHELAHVAGCLISGGTVEELAIKPQYGGTLLQAIFPFVVTETEYAGQLTQFTTPNDFSYLVVDLFPYLFSLFGVALLEWSRRRNQAWVFGLGIILSFIPLLSVPGDYYEAASLLTSQLATVLDPQLPARFLLSDDFPLLISTLRENGQWTVLTGSLAILGFVFAIYLALVTLALQMKLARALFGELEPAAPAHPGAGSEPL